MALEGNASCADCVSQSARNSSPGAQAASGPVTGTLAGILIFTIVVDIVGNLLVILSVCRNKKLRNAAVPDVQRIGPSHLDSGQIPHKKPPGTPVTDRSSCDLRPGGGVCSVNRAQCGPSTALHSNALPCVSLGCCAVTHLLCIIT
ncbi:hypothetical protein SRHO_G00285090 [Serrasalmus rhombeus]